MARGVSRNGLFNPLPGHVMIVAPGLPRGERPLADPANVFFGVNRTVHMNDCERSPLPRSGIARAREDFWAIEPSLDGSAGFGRNALFESRVHALK
jgi:hypothetical protein